MTTPGASTATGDLTSVVRPLLTRALTRGSRESARVRLADTVFSALIGAQTPQGQAGAALARSLYGPSGTLAGLLFRTVAAVRMTEIDDIDLLSCTTPGSVVIPVVLALTAHGFVTDVPAAAGVAAGTKAAATAGADAGPGAGTADVADGLNRVLDVVARGYDLVTGLGEVIDGPSRLADGIWPTLAVAPVAASAVAALLLGMDDDQTGQAAALAGFYRQDSNPRGNARETMLAASVVAGVQAALSVRHGITVTARGPEVPFLGLLRTAQDAGRSPDAGRSGTEDGPSRVSRPAIKHFCSARQVMTAVTAVIRLAGDGKAVAPTDRIVVEVPPAYARMIDKPAVASRRESLASAQYQLAAAVVEPARLLDVGRDDLRLGAGFRAVMDRVSVRAAEDLRASYPRRWPARVRLSAGSLDRHARSDAVPGETDCTVPALKRKFAAFLAAPGAPGACLAGEVLRRSTAGTSLSDLDVLTGLLDSAYAEGGRTADVRVKGLPRQGRTNGGRRRHGK